MSSVHSPARPLIAVLLCVVLLAAAGCGSNPGPSDNKVRLNLFDRANAAFHGLLQPNGFSVTDRQALSEDRIKYHVVVSYIVDPQKAAAAERSANLIGYNNDVLKKARRNDGKEQKLTVLYKRTGPEVWQIAGIRAGTH